MASTEIPGEQIVVLERDLRSAGVNQEGRDREIHCMYIRSDCRAKISAINDHRSNLDP
jgi:hypothetical protein